MTNHRVIPVVMLLVAMTAMALAQNDADTKELNSYRLSVAGLQKFTAVMRSVYAEMKNDPRVQELEKIKSEIKVLEEKEETTEAEDEKLVEETVESLANAIRARLRVAA